VTSARPVSFPDPILILGTSLYQAGASTQLKHGEPGRRLGSGGILKENKPGGAERKEEVVVSVVLL